jgi:AAA15 family ATPase/GTPase
MSDQHIKYLEIRNFKCFKQLDIANIGQVNLIGGKNNAGKTAFLEAVDLFVSSDKVYDLASSVYKILKRRQGTNRSKYLEIDFIYDNESEMTISSSSKTCTLKHSFQVVNNDIFENNLLPTEVLSLSVNDDRKDIPIDAFSGKNRMEAIRMNRDRKANLIYISSSIADEQDIAIAYGKLIELKREYFLNSSLNSFDSDILEFKPIPIEGGTLLKLETKKNLILLSSLGEGINRYIAILCAIWANKDGVLLIDEIENGIHYTNYKKLWAIILQASVDANCQIFITTHSKECIAAFNDVQFENDAQPEDKKCNTQYFEFYKNLKTDLITATVRDKEQLRYELNNEGRVRGE